MVINGQWYPDFPGQLPYMDTQWQRLQQQYQQQQGKQSYQEQQPRGPMMGLPTMDVKIVQVDSLEAGYQLNTPVGEPVMMQLKDDSAFIIKTAQQSGSPLVDVYVKQPQTAIRAPYVTWEAMDARLAGIEQALRKEQGNGSVQESGQ